MFSRLLIANRGEIACRVMRTAHRLGITPIVVFSEADANALHVRMARDLGGEAVPVGPAASAESYLAIEKIVDAARGARAEAVHPGYGFLSENAAFAEALAAAGIAFVGPPPTAIRAMGDKITSKRLAAEAGVSTVPGHMGIIESADEAVAIARDIGLPVMIKASAGGGGKGMRIAFTDDEVRDGVRGARSEAKASFGDDRVFIEKFVEQPRHIEIQVLADAHGSVVHLGERECSVQRRHQKVIEEAPSPLLDAATRAEMGAQAVALARAVGYVSAGTVEFIADQQKRFYFLEMNTRLQVEHPVTEMVTGLDLVELMLRVASGEPLPFAQDDVRLDGWALEARLYAEDPERNFLPSTGRLIRYRPPRGLDGIRLDSGVAEGDEVSMHYDPMIAKLIAAGPDRDTAVARMLGALDRFEIEGLGHNAAFLSAVFAHPRFREGRLSTAFIAEEFPSFEGATLDPARRRRLLAVAGVLTQVEAERAAAGGRQARRSLGTQAPAGPREGRWTAMIDRDPVPLVVSGGGPVWRVDVDGAEVTVEGAVTPGQRLFTGMVDEAPLAVQVKPDGIGMGLVSGGARLAVAVLRPRAAELLALMPEKAPPDMTKFLLSPMPGLLTAVKAQPGEPVKAGQALAVVEAMKMENVLKAERDGTVKAVHAEPGASLAVDQAILEFE